MIRQVKESTQKLEDILPLSDVVITGVPSPSYKVPSNLVREGAVCINFSTHKNFDGDEIKKKASIYVPAVGKVTVAMLERNLVRLYDYQNQDKANSA